MTENRLERSAHQCADATRSLRRALALIAAGALAAMLLAAAAFAWWSMGSASASGTAQAGSMPGGTAPTATPQGGSSVKVVIDQLDFYGDALGTLSGSGYRLTRYPAGGGSAATPGAPCAGLIGGSGATLECTESGLPDGDWEYTVTPVMRTWTGAESSPSNSVDVDATPPAVALTNPVNSLLAGSTTPSATASDSGSGVQSVTIAYRATGDSGAWTDVCTRTSPVSGNSYACNPFDTTALTDGDWDFRAQANDVAGNVGTSVVSQVTIDNTSPSAAAPSLNQSLEGTYAQVTDGGSSDATSGVETVQVQSSTTGSGGWSDFCLITEPAVNCQGDIQGFALGRTFYFRSVVTDAAGNSATSANSSAATAGELLANTGFEATPASSGWECGRWQNFAPTGWALNALCGYDENAGNEHSGQNNAWFNGGPGNWMTIYRPVTTVTNQWYCVSLWARTSNSFAGMPGSYFGLRETTATHNLPGLSPEGHFENQLTYGRHSVKIQADRASGLELFLGTWGESGSSVQSDDFSMRAIPSGSASCPVPPPAPPDPPAAPTDLHAQAIGNSQIRLGFVGVSGVDGYRVYRAKDAEPFDYNNPVSGATPIVGSPWVDTSAEEGESYRYVVRSVLGGVESADSALSELITAVQVPPPMC